MKWMYWLCWMSFGCAFRSVFGMRIRGMEHLVDEDSVLIASNHQSYLDPPLVGNIYQSEIIYLARKTLFRGVGKWLFPHFNALPVDQEQPEMSSLKNIIRLIKNGNKVLVFPEGSRTPDGEIGEAAPGIGLIAVKSGAPIQPVRIRGAFEALPRGSARIRFSRITVDIGPAIRLTPEEIKQYSNKEGYELVSNKILDAIKAL